MAALTAEFPEGADLVTGDGAAEMDHERIEEAHEPLAWAQVRIARRCLSPGGTLVLKVFEGLQPRMRDLVAQLTRSFETVSLLKPGSSRPTNSERYLVCRGFDAAAREEVDGVQAHAGAWVREYDAIVDRLATDQIAALRAVFASVS